MTDQDPIASLLRATGKRPAVSAERSARVREVVRTAWQGEVVRRRRRRWVAAGLAAVATILIAVLAVRSLRGATVSMAPPAVAEVERVVNGAWAESGWFPGLRRRWDLQTSPVAPSGCTIHTAADGRAALRLRMHPHVLRLDHDTMLRIVSYKEFFLERGAVYVDSGAIATEGICITTANGTITDVGTQFEVRLAGDVLSVRVREGRVSVETETGSVQAAASQDLTVDRWGKIVRISDPGSGWEWTETVRPPFSIDGRSLADFLAWAARERGARVRFLDPRLAGRAPAIVLHGSVEGMTLDQAVASVTATSGLLHRWEGGELVVGEAP